MQLGKKEGAKGDDRGRSLELAEMNRLQNTHLQGIPNLKSSDLSLAITPGVCITVSSIESNHGQARAQESIGEPWERGKKEEGVKGASAYF